MSPRLSAEGFAAVERGVGEAAVVQRWAAKIVRIPGDECWWWTGAVSGRGHGRLWLGHGRVVIAHRFSYALVCGVQRLMAAEVLAHRCDNPLCQRVGEGHLVPSTNAANRAEWAARRKVAGSALGDPRGARRRARQLRDLARVDPGAVLADLERLREKYGVQMPLW